MFKREFLLIMQFDDHNLTCEKHDEAYHATPADKYLFYQRFEDMVNRYPRQPALAWQGKTYTYDELNARVNYLAHWLVDNYLEENGRLSAIGNERLIGLFFQSSAEMVISLLAVMKAGLAYVPLPGDDKDTPTERLHYYLQDSRPKCLLTHTPLLTHELLAGNYVQSQLSANKFIKNVDDLFEGWPVGELAPAPSWINNVNLPISRDHLAYVIYSSGSTGKPKGIAIQHGGLLYPVDAHQQLLKIKPGERIAQLCPFTFDASLMEIMMTLGCGACLCILPSACRLSTADIGNFYQEQKITIGIFTPTMLNNLNPKDFPNLHTLVTTGEKISPTLINDWQILGRPEGKKRHIINGYGPSEVSVCTSLGILSENVLLDEDIHVGSVIAGLEVLVLDAEPEDPHQPKKTPLGKKGELYVIGDGVARGYYSLSNDLEYKKKIDKLNAERFINITHPETGETVRAYRTRDQFSCDAQGQLTIYGRLDRQVKVYGRLCAPEEVDESLVSYSNRQVKRAYLATDFDKHGHPQFTAYIQLNDLNKKTPFVDLIGGLCTNIIGHIPTAMLPTFWVQIKEIPLTANQKLDTVALKNKNLIKQRILVHEIVFPEDEYEQKLVEIWRELFNFSETERLSITDNFLHLGGTSMQFFILREQIRNWICEKKNRSFMIDREIFLAEPTIAALARNLRRELEDALSPLVTLWEYPQARSADPVYWIHSIMGDPVIDYQCFIEDYWRPKCALYGFKARGLSDPKNMDMSFSGIARDYVQTLQKHRPHGPYQLAGWSTGGIIAHQMATLLQQRGEQVAVVLIDSINPQFWQNQSVDIRWDHVSEVARHLCNTHQISIDNVPSNAEDLPYADQISLTFSTLKKMPTLNDLAQNRLVTVAKLLHAEASYADPLPVKNSQLLICANNKHRHKMLGWPSTAIAEIKIVPGEHLMILQDKKQAFVVKEHLETFFSRSCANFALHEFKQYLCEYYQRDQKWKVWIPPTLIKASLQQQKIKQVIQNHLSDTKAKKHDLIEFNRLFYQEINYVADPGVSIENWFSSSMENNQAGQKILILGPTGIGKSALCQSIAKRSSDGQLWAGLFDIILLIPMIVLHRHRKGARDNWPNLLKTIGLITPHNNLDQEALSNHLEKLGKHVLYILDGYDQYDPDSSPYQQTVNTLLSNRNKSVLCTSLSHAIPDNNFDQVYELTGFNTEQIHSYMEKFYEHKTKASMSPIKIAEMIMIQQDKYLILQWLARFPSYLKVLCEYYDNEIKAKKAIPSSEPNETFFQTIVELHWARLYNIAYSQLGDREKTLKHCKEIKDILSTIVIGQPSHQQCIFTRKELKEKITKIKRDFHETILANILSTGLLNVYQEKRSSDEDQYYMLIPILYRYFQEEKLLFSKEKKGMPFSSDEKTTSSNSNIHIKTMRGGAFFYPSKKATPGIEIESTEGTISAPIAKENEMDLAFAILDANSKFLMQK